VTSSIKKKTNNSGKVISQLNMYYRYTTKEISSDEQ